MKEYKNITKDSLFNIYLGPNSLYFQLKITSYRINMKKVFMFQFIDRSQSILYKKQKAENKFLSLINAFVSHELRNPLNSIQA